MSTANHFFHRAPIRDPHYFFGRRQETAQLFDLLARGQSVSISGQRRLGKTSLVLHASTPEVCVQHGLDPQTTRWAYLDGGMLDGLQEEAVYGEIDRIIGDEETESVDYTQLLERVRTLATQRLRLIVVLDEFEIFAENPRFQPRLFNRLKGLAAQFPLQFIIASKEPLARLSFANPAVVGSAFFAIFAPFRLSLFNRDEAIELLAELSARGGARFNAETVAFLLELVGPHPQFLQVAAYHAFALQKKGALSEKDRTAVRRKAFGEIEGHLEYYWRELSEQEQYTLAAMPLTAFDGGSPILERLAENALVHENRYLGSILHDFVARQPVPGLLHRGRLSMDERRRLITVDGQLVHLTPTEFAALQLLMQRAGQVVSPEEIERSLWPDDELIDPERARTVMRKLRGALGEAGDVVVNQRGMGYILE